MPRRKQLKPNRLDSDTEPVGPAPVPTVLEVEPVLPSTSRCSEKVQEPSPPCDNNRPSSSGSSAHSTTTTATARSPAMVVARESPLDLSVRKSEKSPDNLSTSPKISPSSLEGNRHQHKQQLPAPNITAAHRSPPTAIGQHSAFTVDKLLSERRQCKTECSPADAKSTPIPRPPTVSKAIKTLSSELAKLSGQSLPTKTGAKRSFPQDSNFSSASRNNSNLLDELSNLVTKVGSNARHAGSTTTALPATNGRPASSTGFPAAADGGGGESALALHTLHAKMAENDVSSLTMQDLWWKYMKKEESAEIKRINEAKQIFTCLQCRQSFEAMDDLVRHMEQTQHFTNVPKHYSWGVQYAKQKMRQMKMKLKYSEKMTYFCNMCQKPFSAPVHTHFAEAHSMHNPVEHMSFVKLIGSTSNGNIYNNTNNNNNNNDTNKHNSNTNSERRSNTPMSAISDDNRSCPSTGAGSSLVSPVPHQNLVSSNNNNKGASTLAHHHLPDNTNADKSAGDSRLISPEETPLTASINAAALLSKMESLVHNAIVDRRSPEHRRRAPLPGVPPEKRRRFNSQELYSQP